MTKMKKKEATSKGMLGIIQLFILISISYLIYLGVMGTSGLAPKIMAFPATGFVIYELVLRFLK